MTAGDKVTQGFEWEPLARLNPFRVSARKHMISTGAPQELAEYFEE
jgi:hypothetical protein